MTTALFVILAALGLHDTHGHANPHLLQQWIFDPGQVTDAQVRERRHRLVGALQGRAAVTPATGLVIDGMDGVLEVGPMSKSLRQHLPSTHMLVSAWVLISTPTEWGGIAGILQDNGEHEEGWLLGYREDHFCFALAGADSEAPQGDLTYLTAPEAFALGQWYHVAGSYDGRAMQLWVDGVLVAESTEQSGPIRYPASGRMVIGAYVDANEYYPMDGAVQHVRLQRVAAGDAAVQEEMAAYPDMRGAGAPHRPFQLLVGPYLQDAREDGVTIMWETTRPGRGWVEYGPTAALGQRAESPATSTSHEVALTDLPIESNWFYRAGGASGEDAVESPVLTFQTKTRPDTPLGFIVVGDTQNNPAVTHMMSNHAWSHRPHFIMHCGDLVGTGTVKREWVQEFFGSTGDLLGRFPIYPTLGNHERDAQLYYDYFSLPGKEYYYDYRWGDVHVFVLDTNKDISPESEQYQWLAKALPASDAKWKIVQHHQPAWTSDSNDYGDTFTGGSTWGDMNVRAHLVPLYEANGVDVVFNGHIHVYERTWPILGDQVDHDRGVIYVTTGGAGGSLEDFAPTRTWFTAHKYRGHHYCIVTAHDRSFELRAFDQDGKLIDFFSIADKPSSAAAE